MPPKKRVRGPQLSPVREDSSGLSPEKVIEQQQPNPSTSKKVEKSREEVAREEAELDAIDTLPNAEKQAPISASKKMKNAEILLRSNIVNSFRQTFQARGNIIDNIKHSSQQLLNAYKKTTRPRGALRKDVFFNEIDIRLCMMIEDTTVIENRIRVLKLVCETACNLIIETGDDSILDFLVNNFFLTWSKCSEIAPRINIASFIGYLLESGVSKKKNSLDFAIFDISYVKKLYEYLLTLILDKVQVRIAAIRAISVIQNVPIPNDFTEAIEFSPKEVLMRSFRDIAWECRLAAVEVFKPTREHVPQLMQLCLYDKCVNVRCEALKQFGMLPLSPSDAKMIIELMYTCLNDHDNVIRQAVSTHIIDVWMKDSSEKYRKNHEPKSDGDCIETDPTGKPLMSLENDKKVEGYGYVAQHILCFLYKGADTPDLKFQVRSIMMKVLKSARKFYNVHLEPYEFFATSYVEDAKYDNETMIHRSSYHDLINSGGRMFDREKLIAFWRCMIDYCAMGARNNKNDAIAAVERLAPKMVKMCDFVRNLLELFKEVEETEMDGDSPVLDMELCSIQQTNMLKDVLLIFHHLDRDPTGMNAWRKLLEDILYNISNHKSLLDIVVHDLMNNFYKDSPSDILSDVAGGISDMMNRITCGDATLRDETVFIGSAKTRKIDQQQKEVLLAITEYELMILNSILKTGLITNVDSILRTKYETLVIPKLKSPNLDDRILAIECIAMIGVLSLDQIEHDLIVCRRMAEIGELDVKICYVDMIVDLCVVHSTEKVQEIIDKHTVGGATKKKEAKTIVDTLCEPILSEDVKIKNSDLALKCCEGLGKLLLHEDIDPEDKMWRKALITLLSRLNYKLDGKFAAKVRSVITTVFKFFASIRKSNQKALANCFKPLFAEWDRNPNLVEAAGDSEYIYKRLCRCASLIALLTRHSILINKQKNELPCHVDLLMEALKELMYNQDSSASNYYCEVMPWIELDMIPTAELKMIDEEVAEALTIYDGDNTKGRLGELKKLNKRVKKALGIQDKNDDGAVEAGPEVKEEIIDEEMPDANEQPSPPPSKITKATPARVRRNASNTASKTPAPKKDVVVEIRDLIDSPVQESVTKKPTRPVSEARVHLKRSARRLKNGQ